MAKLRIAKELFDLFFPVGYIYTSMNSTDPKTLFGYGEWTQITNRFLYCTTTSKTTGGASSVSYTPGGTVNYHTLTIDEIPPHHHTYGNWIDWYTKGNVTGIISNGGDGIGWTSDVGGGLGHNHGFTGAKATISTMPPYMSCYAWYRTA